MFTAWLWMYFWIKRRWILTWYIKASPQASITCKVDLHVPDIKSPWLISKNWCCWVLQLQYISLWIKCPLCSAFHLLPTWEAASLSSQVTEMRRVTWVKGKSLLCSDTLLGEDFHGLSIWSFWNVMDGSRWHLRGGLRSMVTWPLSVTMTHSPPPPCLPPPPPAYLDTYIP